MSYNWRYFKTGRVMQVKIETGEDVAHLKELDRKLWTALSAPIHGLRFDRRTLELIDADHDGVVRAPEVLAAVDWALANVASPDDLFQTDEKKAELHFSLNKQRIRILMQMLKQMQLIFSFFSSLKNCFELN